MGYSFGTDRKLHEIAITQKGVFSLAQAARAGVVKSVILERHANERLFRVYRGSYSLLREVSREGIWWAGVLAAGEGSVLSHMSALRLWDITTWIGPTEVLRRGNPGISGRSDGRKNGSGTSAVTGNTGSAIPESGGRIPVLKIRGTRNLHSSEITAFHGIPVTTVARTFVDVCGSIGKGQLKRLLHEAARQNLLDFAELRAAMGRARGKKGVGRLREIIDDWDPQIAWTRNEMEKKVKDLLQKGGLPEPLVNRIVGGHRVDFLYEDCGLIIEADGSRDHNAPFGVERDKERDSELQLKGFRILRLTRAMIERDPEGSLRKVREHRELCLAEGRRADPGWATASIGHGLPGPAPIIGTEPEAAPESATRSSFRTGPVGTRGQEAPRAES